MTDVQNEQSEQIDAAAITAVTGVFHRHVPVRVESVADRLPVDFPALKIPCGECLQPWPCESFGGFHKVSEDAETAE